MYKIEIVRQKYWSYHKSSRRNLIEDVIQHIILIVWDRMLPWNVCVRIIKIYRKFMKMGIDGCNFIPDVDLPFSSSIILSLEKLVSLNSSLTILKDQYLFHLVKSWSIILSISNTRFTIQRQPKNEFSERNFFYRFLIQWRSHLWSKSFWVVQCLIIF